MKFFPERNKNDRPIIKILRFFALISVFIIMGSLFWKNNQKAMHTISGKMAIWDQTKTLSEAQKKSLHRLHRDMRSMFGIKLKISITKEELTPPRLDSKTLFIGLCPARQEAFVHFPPLVLRALGKQFRDELQHKHFAGSWHNREWVRKLGQAVHMISQKLIAIEHETDS